MIDRSWCIIIIMNPGPIVMNNQPMNYNESWTDVEELDRRTDPDEARKTYEQTLCDKKTSEGRSVGHDGRSGLSDIVRGKAFLVGKIKSISALEILIIIINCLYRLSYFLVSLFCPQWRRQLLCQPAPTGRAKWQRKPGLFSPRIRPQLACLAMTMILWTTV